MDVTGLKRAEDLDFHVPKQLAKDINAYVDALARDDENLDCYWEEVWGSARMVSEQNNMWIIKYYLNDGWMATREQDLGFPRPGEFSRVLTADIDAATADLADGRQVCITRLSGQFEGHVADAGIIEAGSRIQADTAREVLESLLDYAVPDATTAQKEGYLGKIADDTLFPPEAGTRAAATAVRVDAPSRTQTR